MTVKMIIHMVVPVLLIVGTISAIPTQELYCTTHSDEKLELFGRVSMYCTNIDVQKGDILRLKSPITGYHNFVAFISVTGHIDETALSGFPEVRRVVVSRSNITGITLNSETKAFALANSSFPKVTRETLKGVKHIRELIFLANPGLEFEVGAFKDLKKMTGLGIFNQTIPQLQRRFLEGPDRLKGLILNLNNLTEIEEDAFVDHPHLELIVLDDNPLESFKVNISTLSDLKELSLANTNLKEINLISDFSGSLNWLYRLFLPTRLLLDNFNSTLLKSKFPKLGIIGILKEDSECPEIKKLSETLQRQGLMLSTYRDYVYLTYVHRPSIC